MGLITYILRAYIEKCEYPIFNVCPMYFFSDDPDKLENINTFVVENDFFTEKQKKIYMELFSKAQKHYFSFSKLARIWKIKKYSYYNNDVDLCLKSLDSFPESQKITLIHFKKKYVFSTYRFNEYLDTCVNKKQWVFHLILSIHLIHI